MGISEKLIITNTAKQNIKQAIIDKGVDMTAVPFTSYHTKIAEITGGGDPPVDPPVINPIVRFFDYDGTLLKEEEVEIGNDATAPTLPDYSSPGVYRPALTFQEWNHPFTNIQKDTDVGAIYVPTDTKTHIFLDLDDGTSLTRGFNFYNTTSSDVLTVNWGDGLFDTYTSTTLITATHTYSTSGVYDMTVWRSSGTSRYGLGYDSTNKLSNDYSSTLNRTGVSKLYCGLNVHLRVYMCNGDYSLDTVTLPNDIYFPGADIYQFINTKNLTHINIPSNVAVIPSDMFSNSVLERAILPLGLTTISTQAFYKSRLKSIILPSTVRSLDLNVFGYTYITSIDISNITSLSDGVFWNCSKLTTTNWPSTIHTIPGRTFSYASALTSITSDLSHITQLGYSAFEHCISLSSLVFGNIASSGTDVFNECTSLSSLVLGTNLTSIPANMFKNCSSLSSLVIGSPLSNIESSAFYGCGKLTTTSLTLVCNDTTFGISAFNACPLENVVLTGTINTISMAAFGSEFIETIDLPDTYKINNAAINVGVRLSTVNFNGSLTIMSGNGFSKCPMLKSLTLPSTLTTISSGFLKSETGCTNLNWLVCLATTPPALAMTAAMMVNKIYVPDDSVDAYKAETNWTLSAAKIFPLSTKP